MTEETDSSPKTEGAIAARPKIVFSIAACVLILAGCILMLAVKPYRARLNVMQTQLKEAEGDTAVVLQEDWSALSRAAWQWGNAAVTCAALGIIAWRIGAHRRETGLPAWLLPVLLVIYLALHMWSLR